MQVATIFMLTTLFFHHANLQLSKVDGNSRVKGPLSSHSLAHKLCSLILFCFSQARNYIRSLARMEKKNFHDVFKGANPLGKKYIQLVGNCQLVVLEKCPREEKCFNKLMYQLMGKNLKTALYLKTDFRFTLQKL